MKKILYLSLLLSICMIFVSCILSSTPEEKEVMVSVGETKGFQVKVLSKKSTFTWLLNNKIVATQGDTFEYTPGSQDVGKVHILEVNVSSGFLTGSRLWYISVIGEIPILDELEIKAFSATSITLRQPTFHTSGDPEPAISAYIGLNGDISYTENKEGVIVKGYAIGPADVSKDNYQFTDLEFSETYDIIVVAQNSIGYSVKRIDSVHPGIPEVNPLDYPDIGEDEMGHLRWILNICDQAMDDFTNLESSDTEQLGFSSFRYVIAFSTYFLSLVQYHKLPACPEIIKPNMDRFIQKIIQKPVWEYWAKVSPGLPFLEPLMNQPYPVEHDPVRVKNIMYSGHLGHMIALYEMLYQDLKWSEENAIVFSWSDDEQYKYDNHSLQKVMYEEMMNNKDNCIECEPNACFPECNQHPVLSFMLYDHVHNTNLSEAKEYFLDFFLREKMLNPVTHMVCGLFLVKQGRSVHQEFPGVGNLASLILIPASMIGFLDIHSPTVDGWTGAFMHAWEPEFIEYHYPFQKAKHIVEEPDGTAHPLPEMVTDQLSTGFFGLLASEVGDLELRDKLVSWAKEFYEPVWEDGMLHYESGEDVSFNMTNNYVPHSNVMTGKLIALALANEKNGLWAMHNKPFDGKKFQEPKVINVEFPNVLLNRAIYDREKEALIVTTRPGAESGGSTNIIVDHLDPKKEWQLIVDGQKKELISNKSSVTIDVDLDDIHDYVLIVQ